MTFSVFAITSFPSDAAGLGTSPRHRRHGTYACQHHPVVRHVEARESKVTDYGRQKSPTRQFRQ
jgi:hypothetical protein